MHRPHLVWVKHTKAHNNGGAINLLNPSEYQMAGDVLQFPHVIHLKTILQACTQDHVFVDYKNSVSLLTYLIVLNFGSVSVI
jgi:hypothetical protein